MPRAIVASCVALCAALMAHVAIDVAGDYLLARDSYDAIDHHSRALVALGALALALFAAGAALRAAFAEARGDERVFRALLRASLPASRVRFAAEVVGLTLLGLLAMEALDAALAGQRVDDIGDLLGGSLWLGFGLVAVCGVLAALAAGTSLARLAGARDVLLRAIAAFVRLVWNDPHARATSAEVRRARPFAAAPLLARRLAGRAPPAALPTVR